MIGNHRIRRLGHPRRRRLHPVPETLERRSLLATATWVSPVSGFWDDPANWLNNRPPEPGDDVVIRVPSGDVVVTYRGLGTDVIGDFTNQEQFVIQSGSTFRWLGGTWGGGGSVLVEPGAGLEISGGNSKGIGRLTLTNQGSITWSGGSIGLIVGRAILVNDTTGEFEIQTDDDLVSVGGLLTFENRGRLAKTTGSGETRLLPPGSELTTTGLVEVTSGVLGFDAPFVQNGFPATETRLAGGDLRFGQGATLNAGLLTGSGTLFGDLTNANATIAPGGDQIGTITIVGNFAQIPGTTVALPTLAMQISGTDPSSEIDRLLVRRTPELTGGTSQLGGVLSVTTLGPFNPVLGDRFPLIEAFASSGKFAETTLPPLPPNVFWLVDYASDGTALEVVNTLSDLTITGFTATPASARVGELLTYRVTVTNSGPNGAANVRVTDVLPPGLDFVADESTAAAQFDPVTRTVTVPLGFFSVGATSTVRIAVRPTAAFVGAEIINTVTVTSDEPDPDRTNNTATLSVPLIGASSLTVDVSGPPQVGVGLPAVYVVTVRNNGPSVATNVEAAFAIPPNTVLRADQSTPGLNLNSTGTVVSARLGSLPVGALVQLTVVVVPTVATSGRQIEAFAAASSNETGDQPASDSASTEVLAAPQVIGVRRLFRVPGVLVVAFDQAMDPRTASNPANYDLRSPGRDGILNTADDRIYRIRSVVYDAARNLVRIRFRGPLSATRNNVLRVAASGTTPLQNLQGIPLAGNGSGFPGFDFVQRFAPRQLRQIRLR
ncbi:MAG: hypothetical protein KatS3mg108_2072 [Isosphaeraceae bacterium]|jgi:uncharacterized repeat protein (TIGR01451 family)|nr:MAG: hypothetical protein KatS3mg108_2072 [Isosphaeraceae bacterium]